MIVINIEIACFSFSPLPTKIPSLDSWQLWTSQKKHSLNKSDTKIANFSHKIRSFSINIQIKPIDREISVTKSTLPKIIFLRSQKNDGCIKKWRRNIQKVWQLNYSVSWLFMALAPCLRASFRLIVRQPCLMNKSCVEHNKYWDF